MASLAGMPGTSTLVAYLPTVLLGGLTIAIATFFRNMYANRMFFRKLIKQGMPVAPEHSFLLGHLLFIKSVMSTLPADAHQNLAFGEVARRWFAKEGLYYIDLWPFSEPMLIIVSAALAVQATQTLPGIATQKPPYLRTWFRPLTGGPSLFEMPEAEWKPWRAIFNKAFSPVHLWSLVPGMVADARVYVDNLRQHARASDLFYLDPLTLRFMIDIIGRSALNAPLGAQKGYNVLADSMRSQIKLHQPSKQLNPLAFINVVVLTQQWLNGRRMDHFVGQELDKRYEEYRAGTANTRSKSIMDVALQAYLADKSAKTSSSPSSAPSPAASDDSDLPPPPLSVIGDKLDPEFRAFAISQMRLFLFVGHDSTSSTICYMIHLLSTHPEALARVRAEHDAVFGRDLARVPELLAAEPHRLNELPFSLAAIKETTRLFPAASSIRYGRAGVDLVAGYSIADDANGAAGDSSGGSSFGNGIANGKGSIGGNYCSDGPQRYPTEHMSIWMQHPAMQRMPENGWVRGDEFLPERWLVGPEHPLHVGAAARAAWRAFEHGPRNCPGQALVLLEMRVVLVLLAREFDFAPAYAEWDASMPERELARRKGPLREYRGERVYQVEEGAAHPADHYPCRVAFNPAYKG